MTQISHYQNKEFRGGNFRVFFSIDLSSLDTRRSNVFTSSAGGSSSGLMPRFPNISRTERLFCTCSDVMGCSPDMFFSTTLWLIISVARFLAAIVRVGKKSASGRLDFMPSRNFMSSVVFPPNNVASPFERMRPNPFSSTPRSKMFCESCFSETRNLSLVSDATRG